MKCPVCGAAELIHGSHDIPYSYKGETTVITSVKGDLCPECGEVVLEAEETDRYGSAIVAFHKQVNALSHS